MCNGAEVRQLCNMHIDEAKCSSSVQLLINAVTLCMFFLFRSKERLHSAYLFFVSSLNVNG